MSALTKLAALRMEENELLRTSCAKCGHSLRDHGLSGQGCKHHDVLAHVTRDPARAKLKYCKCREFSEVGQTESLFT